MGLRNPNVNDSNELRFHPLRRRNPEAAPKNNEFQFIDKKGYVRHACMTVAMLPGTAKSVVSLLDVTERKRAEDAFRRMNADLENVFEKFSGCHWYRERKG
jgi:PAS domain S-box-containing protein